MSDQVPVDAIGRTHPDDATVTLETRFGPDYITVEHERTFSGERVVLVGFDETTDPVDGYQQATMAFHATRPESNGLPQLVAFRDALNAAIEYLRQP